MRVTGPLYKTWHQDSEYKGCHTKCHKVTQGPMDPWGSGVLGHLDTLPWSLWKFYGFFFTILTKSQLWKSSLHTWELWAQGATPKCKSPVEGEGRGMSVVLPFLCVWAAEWWQAPGWEESFPVSTLQPSPLNPPATLLSPLGSLRVTRPLWDAESQRDSSDCTKRRGETGVMGEVKW